MVLRLAPTVHGPGDHGFVPLLIANARRTGISAYVGDGSNRWPAVHRLDAADVYRLALEHAQPGTVVHAVGEQVPFIDIATTIGERLGVPVRAVDPADSGDHFGNPFMAAVFATDNPVSADHTRELLGWVPTHWTLLDDLGHGDYFDVASLSPA